jgi:hypothetical protein
MPSNLTTNPGETEHHAAEGTRKALGARDVLLGSAALIVAAGGLLGFGASLLSFIESFEGERLSLNVAEGLSMFSSIAWIPAFAYAGLAFLGQRESRTLRLAIAFALGALSLLFLAAGAAVSVFLQATTDFYPGTGTAATAVGTVAAVLALMASWIAAVAFYRTRESGLGVRDGRLGWAAVGGAAFLAFSAVSGILKVIFYSDLSATSKLTSGLGIATGGRFIAAGALVVVAVAFFLSAARQREPGVGWFKGRENLLAIGVGIFAGAFLLVAIGSLLSASALSENGATGKSLAAGWLQAVESLFPLAAATCASVGFFLSRQSRN